MKRKKKAAERDDWTSVRVPKALAQRLKERCTYTKVPHHVIADALDAQDAQGRNS